MAQVPIGCVWKVAVMQTIRILSHTSRAVLISLHLLAAQQSLTSTGVHFAQSEATPADSQNCTSRTN